MLQDYLRPKIGGYFNTKQPDKKVLVYEEAPEKMPKQMYNEIHREFAKRLNSMSGDEKWVTFGKFFSELDHYRDKFDREGNTEKLALLDKYDKYVIGIQKKFEVA